MALDGENGRNSPFTEAFLRNIDKSEPLTLVLQDISADVYRSTNNSQSPWIAGTFRTNPRYSMGGKPPAAAPAAVTPAPQAKPAAAPERDRQEAVKYFTSGNTYREKGDYDRAITDYDQAIRLDPKYTVAYINRGVAY